MKRGLEDQSVKQFLIRRTGETQEQARWDFEQYLNGGDNLLAQYSQQVELPEQRAVDDLPAERIKEIVFTKLATEPCEPYEDDPHADWSDDNAEDDAEGHDASRSRVEANQIELPASAIADSEIESDNENDLMQVDHQALQHAETQESGKEGITLLRYHQLTIQHLCEVTFTELAEEHVIEGIEAALTYLQDKELMLEFEQEEKHTTWNRVFYVFVWLLVCHRVRIGDRPKRRSLALTCGVLYNVGLKLVAKNHPVFATRFKDLEKRLMNDEFLQLPWYTCIKSSSSGDFEAALDTDAKQYVEVLNQEGLLAFVELIIAKEHEGPKTSSRKLLPRPAMAQWARGEMLRMFAAVDRDLLQSCLSRRLSQDSRNRHHPTRRALRANAKRASTFPAQYVNIICDRSGSPPTNFQCLQICEDIVLYLSDRPESAALAERIDQAIAATSKWPRSYARRGVRRYPDWRSVIVKKKFRKDHNRREVIAYFIQQLLIELQDAIAQGRLHVPRHFSWIEIGFSDKPIKRLRAHARHIQSNYLMNLVHAALQVRFPGVFILQQEILSLCFSAGHTNEHRRAASINLAHHLHLLVLL